MAMRFLTILPFLLIVLCVQPGLAFYIGDRGAPWNWESAYPAGIMVDGYRVNTLNTGYPHFRLTRVSYRCLGGMFGEPITFCLSYSSSGGHHPAYCLPNRSPLNCDGGSHSFGISSPPTLSTSSTVYIWAETRDSMPFVWYDCGVTRNYFWASATPINLESQGLPFGMITSNEIYSYWFEGVYPTCSPGCGGSTLYACDGEGYESSATPCTYGCNGFVDECYAQDDIPCSEDVCNGGNPEVLDCVLGKITGQTNCTFGCNSGTSPASCFEEFDLGAICMIDDSFCDGSEATVNCSDGTVVERTDCDFGCNSSSCFGQYELGAMCLDDMCDSNFLANCTNGTVTERKNCTWGCNAYGIPADYCYAQNDQQCSLPMQCEGDVLVNCTEGLVSGRMFCPFDCKSDEFRCYDEHEIGANCTRHECDGGVRVNCSDGTVNQRLDCLYGCNSTTALCNNQHRIGALCSSDACDGATVVVTCTSGFVTSRDECSFGCRSGSNRCYREHEIGALCSTDACDVSTFVDCEGNSVVDRRSCEFGCNNASVDCFAETDVGALCLEPVCAGDDLVLCNGGVVTAVTTCVPGEEVCVAEEAQCKPPYRGMEVFVASIAVGVVVLGVLLGLVILGIVCCVCACQRTKVGMDPSSEELDEL